jgi:hypothetical protein
MHSGNLVHDGLSYELNLDQNYKPKSTIKMKKPVAMHHVLM